MKLVVCENLLKKFGGKIALKNVSFEIPKGLTLILGKNGSGKTTLVKIISTLLPFDSGKITVCGVDVKEKRTIRDMISYLPQETLVEDILTLRELLIFHSNLFGVSEKRAIEIGERIGLYEMGTFAGELSGGMKRRLCVALSLIPEKEIYILDEPFESIDFGGRMRIRELLLEILKEKKSIIIVSHTVTGLEELADHILILDEGVLRFSGKPEDLKKHFKNLASIRIKPNDVESELLIEDAISKGLTVTQIDVLSLVGEAKKVESLAENYGISIESPTISEIYAFFVSRGENG